MRSATVVCLGLVSAACRAQFGGEGNYPQFRSLSGLPGSAFGVMSDGHASIRGAMSLSIPIAYSLTDWEFIIAVSNLSPDLSPGFPRGKERDLGGNGTGLLMLGVPLGRFGSATVSHMILSNKFDNAQNVLWAPPGQSGAVRFAIGVQDVSGQGGQAGEVVPGQDPGESRTWFGVATWQSSDSTHLSVGLGDTRFKRGFIGVSHTFAERWKAVLEHDGYNWNVGVGVGLGPLGSLRQGRTTDATLFVGVLRGEFAYWSVGFKF